MQNLAGHPKATAICAVELQQAGIPVELLATPYGEPKSDIGGRLGDFTFRRAWYYWVVRGPMPLAQAEAMYARPVGALDVRVAGHCGCPPPAEWAHWRTPDGRIVHHDPTGSQRAQLADIIARHPDFGPCEDVFADDASRHPDASAYVESYHVDSAEGLALLARVIATLPPAPDKVAVASRAE